MYRLHFGHHNLFPLQEKTQEMCLGMQIIEVVHSVSPHMHKCTVQICTVSIQCLHVYAGQNVLSKTDGEIVQHVSLENSTNCRLIKNN